MKVIKGKTIRPRRCLLYGTHGIGKSTWAANSESPLVLQCERGLDDIGVDRTPLLESFDDVMKWLRDLASEQHDYKTVVIDTLDWLEKVVFQSCADRHGKASIEDFGYGKGYKLAQELWDEILKGLDWLNQNKGLAVVLLAHAKVERFEDPESDPYDRYAPDLHKTCTAHLQEWCDEVLFARYVVDVVTQTGDFGATRNKAIGDGRRVVYTAERPTHYAKRHIQLPDQMPLDWAEYRKHWPGAANGKGDISGLVKDGSSKTATAAGAK